METPTNSLIRCAIYARYSSEVQRKTSTEDQIRECRAAAERNGWVVLDEFIRFDEELTGRTLVGRQGLADLIQLAKQRPVPFDCILIYDTSRLGRYLPDVMRECDRLTHYGVFIYFVSDRLDSRDESFRILHLFKGYRDEDFIRDLANKIHRGQEGRVLKGYVSGNSCYGFKNVPIPDESRKGSFGKPALIGVKQEIIPDEAQVVRRIMEMRASGLSFQKISRTLITEGIAPPRNPNKAGIPAWYPSTIKQITRNELYRGWRMWNRTQNLFNKAEGKKSKRKRPQSEWIRQEVPDLRIISDELWNKVQDVNRRRGKGYAQRLGGLNRSAASRKYLFSGVLYCGICGGPYTVIGGKAPNVRYGCPNYRFRGTCTNRVSILRTRLEQQLISALSKNLLSPALEEERTREFSEQLRATLDAEAKLASEVATNGRRLRDERTELQKRAANLVDAIARHGLSSLLSSELTAVETRLSQIEHQLTAKPTKKPPSFSDDEIQEFLGEASQQFCSILSGDPERAKHEIQKRITKLVITPKETAEGRRLEVSGDVALFVEDDVMVNSSLEGIAEHYTRSRVGLTGVVLDPSLSVAP